MPQETKPEIVKGFFTSYTTFKEDTGRLLKTLIIDIKRVYCRVDNGNVTHVDADILKVCEHLKAVTYEFELLLAYKFPEACDITAADLEKYYNIKS